MDHIVNKLFSYAQREIVLDLAKDKFKDFYVGSYHDVEQALLLRGKLLLVDRKGVDSLAYYEKVALEEYLSITDACEFLEEYTETLNIDDIVRSLCGDGDIEDAVDAIQDIVAGVQRDAEGAKLVLSLNGIHPIVPTFQFYYGIDCCYKHLDYWAKAMRDLCVYYLYNTVLSEDNNADLEPVHKFVNTYLPIDVLFYVSYPVGKALDNILILYKKYSEPK